MLMLDVTESEAIRVKGTFYIEKYQNDGRTGECNHYFTYIAGIEERKTTLNLKNEFFIVSKISSDKAMKLAPKMESFFYKNKLLFESNSKYNNYKEAINSTELSDYFDQSEIDEYELMLNYGTYTHNSGSGNIIYNVSLNSGIYVSQGRLTQPKLPMFKK